MFFSSVPSYSTSTTPTSSTSESAVFPHPTTTIPATSNSKDKQSATAPVEKDNFYANLRYLSQLLPVFTNAYVMQEEKHLYKHQVEILKHELAVTAKNTVMVFDWTMVHVLLW
jgi:hypothetical protein